MRTWRFWPIVLPFLLALVVVAYQHRSGVKAFIQTVVFGQQAPTRGHLDIGELLPPVNLLDLLGTRTNIAAQPGRVLVINVFATWCPDCVEEAPALSELRDAYAGKAVDIIGIDQDERPEAVLQFARAYNWNFPIYIDDHRQTQHILGVHYIPATFVVDEHGRVRAQTAGPLTLSQMKLLVQRGFRRVGKS